jgi:hypothetical protein
MRRAEFPLFYARLLFAFGYTRMNEKKQTDASGNMPARSIAFLQWIYWN